MEAQLRAAAQRCRLDLSADGRSELIEEAQEVVASWRRQLERPDQSADHASSTAESGEPSTSPIEASDVEASDAERMSEAERLWSALPRQSDVDAVPVDRYLGNAPVRRGSYFLVPSVLPPDSEDAT